MIFADAHVHLHDCFDPKRFLRAAVANFRSASYSRNDIQAILLLAESDSSRDFEQFVSSIGRVSPWRIIETKESCSIWLSGNDREGTLGVVGGSQIVSREGIEVLGLLTDSSIQNSLPIIETISAVRDQGGIPVLPWGFGKWMGQRGKIVSDLLEKEANSNFFLGDNGGRPCFIPESSIFKRARQKGFRILPGSDPLPIAKEIERVGGYGFYLRCHLSRESPGKDLKDILLGSSTTIVPYGRLLPPVSFLMNQIMIRLGKRF